MMPLLLAKHTPVTYATWDPAGKSASITLSGSNLIATGPSSTGTFYAVRSTIGKASGKWYWELTIGTVGSQANGIGSSSQLLEPDSSLTDLEGLRVYYKGGDKYQSGGSPVAYGAAYVGGDVLGAKLDMDAKTLEMLKNNSSQGTLVSGLTGTMYAYFASTGSTLGSVTANFGASPFVYSLPAGYSGLLV